MHALTTTFEYLHYISCRLANALLSAKETIKEKLICVPLKWKRWIAIISDIIQTNCIFFLYLKLYLSCSTYFFYQQVYIFKMYISEIKMRAKLVIKWILFLKMTHYTCCVLSTLLVTTNLTHAWVDLVIHDITRCPYSLILMCWLINQAITA